MKVVLDLTRLLQDGKITQEEHDRLLRFAAGETGSLAINILIGLGVIAVSGGVLALLMNAIAVIVLGALLLAAGLASPIPRPSNGACWRPSSPWSGRSWSPAASSPSATAI
jgi:uncharacterized membrane protein